MRPAARKPRTKRFWRGLGFRLAIAVFLFGALYAALVGRYTYSIVWNVVHQEVSTPVRRMQNSYLSAYRVYGRARLIDYIDERMRTQSRSDTAVLLAAPNGEFLAGNVEKWPTRLSGNEKFSVGLIKIRDIADLQYMGFTVSNLEDGSRLLIGVPILSVAEIGELQLEIILASVVFSFWITLALWLVATRITRSYTKDAARVAYLGSQGIFTERIRLSGSGDRLDQLFALANRSLDRIEPMVQEMRTITTGIAHDIRTPLSRLRTMVDRARLETTDPAALTEFDRIEAEVITLLSMISKTMEIAQAENMTTQRRFEACSAAAILGDMADMYRPLAEDLGFTLSVDADPRLTLMLHRYLFEKALSNLIENVLKYADGGTHIELSVKTEGDDVLFSVTDNGVGIPEHRFEDAMRRYGRLDPARNIPGSGLGMTIAEAVARLHGGSLRLSSGTPGLRVTMHFPMQPA